MSVANKNLLLSDFLIDYVKGAGGFQADIIAPPVEVAGRTFRYPSLTAGNMSRNTKVAVGAGGDTLVSDMTTSNTAGIIDVEYRNIELVDNAKADEHPRGMSGAIEDSAAILARRVGLENEIGLATVAATISATATAAGGAWNGGSATDPVGDIQKGFKSVREGAYGGLANVVAFPYDAFQRWSLESDVQAFVKGSSNQGAIGVQAAEQALSLLNGGEVKIILLSAGYDVAGTYTEAWTTSVVYVLRQSSDRMGIRALSQFTCPGAEGVFTKEDTEPASRGMQVEAKLVRKPVLTAAAAGYKITTA